jgi:hypothetical protein
MPEQVKRIEAFARGNNSISVTYKNRGNLKIIMGQTMVTKINKLYPATLVD